MIIVITVVESRGSTSCKSPLSKYMSRVKSSLVPRPSNGNEEIGWVAGEGLGNNVHLPRAGGIRQM